MRGRRRWLAVPGVAMVVLLAGCGGDPSDDDTSSPAASVSASPSEDPAVATAKKAVVAAYTGMVDEQVKAFAKGSLKGSKLDDYAAEKSLSNLKGALLFNIQQGIVTKGEPKFEVTSTTVDLDSSPHEATLTVCFDNNTWKSYDKKTGKSVSAPNQQKRYVVTEKLRTIGKRWFVIDGTTDREQAC